MTTIEPFISGCLVYINLKPRFEQMYEDLFIEEALSERRSRHSVQRDLLQF